MPSIKVLNQLGQEVKDLSLSEEVFACEANNQVIADVIDENMLAKDGISIKYCLAESEEFINPSNLKKFNIYLLQCIDTTVQLFILLIGSSRFQTSIAKNQHL